MTEAPLLPERLPPQNLEAEQSVLGGMLIDNETVNRVIEVLRSEDFYRPAHQLIYQAITALYQINEPSDLITITNWLKKEQLLDQAGGPAYLAQLVDQVPATANITHYAHIVYDKAVLRHVISGAGDIIQKGYEAKGDVDQYLDQAEKIIFEIAQRKVNQSFAHVKDIVKDSFKMIEQLYEKKEAVTGVPTGFDDFDKMTSGLQSSDLVIIAGRPSMGKTALALNMAGHAAIHSGHKVAIFSLEMSKEQLVQRLLCSEARVDSSRLRVGFLNDSDWPKLTRAAGALSEAPIYIDDMAAQTVLEMRAKCRRLQREKGLDLIVVDYLQLMRGNSRFSESREREIADISRSLKAMAKEMRVPVVALSQLNRGLESRQDKRPQLSDLRECVTGDTLVLLANGHRVPIRDLVGKMPKVLAMNSEQKIVSAESDKVWVVGRRPVFKLNLASGRSVKATALHRLFTGTGWRRVEEMAAGDRIGIARHLPEPAAFGPKVEGARRLDAILKETIENTNSDLFWDRLVSIESLGEEEVFDLTVPGHESWLADGIVSHNSGALEQDADVIAFVYRDEVYNKESPDKGQAEIIIGKQRNGPIGIVRLAFLNSFTRFENLARTADVHMADLPPALVE